MKKMLSKIGGSRKASNTTQEPLSTSQANATFGATTGGFGSSTTSFEFRSTPSTGTFGSAMADFGQQQQQVNGTTVKFQPVNGSDTMLKSGVLLNVSTRHQCISCMTEYNTFTLEELRYAHYMAYRKGTGNVMTAPGFTSATTGLFGASPNQTALATGGLFGANISQVNATFGEITGSFGNSTTVFGFRSTPRTSGSECSTCYEARTRTFALLPCGHATFCEKCATYFSESSDKRCPICRAKITGKVRLFL